ncbi:MAG: hypothetical protein J6333_00890, partial [Planctomycetes bacterium]|nr:hypothetical protein [Planctomycetota bacterium]
MSAEPKTPEAAEPASPPTPKPGDPLNPSVRPTEAPYKHRKGGPTINKVGLMIAYGVAAIFIFWIVLGIFAEPGKDQNKDTGYRKASADSYAANIIGQIPRRPKPRPAAAEKKPEQEFNIVAKRKEIPPLRQPSAPRARDDDELAEIRDLRREKIREFAAAVRSGTDAMGGHGGMGVTPSDARRNAIQAEIARVQQEIDAAKALGNEAAARSQLAKLNALKANLAALPAPTPTASDTTVAGFSSEGTLAELARFGNAPTGAIRGDMVQPPATRYVLRTGSVIPATLVGGLNSDLPG